MRDNAKREGTHAFARGSTQRLEVELEQYERREAAWVEALKIVQRHRGWVSDEAIRDVAAFLG